MDQPWRWKIPLLKMGNFPLPAMLGTTGGYIPLWLRSPRMRTDSHQARLVLFFFPCFLGSGDLYKPTVNLPLLLGGGCIFPQLCCTLCFYVFCFVLSKFQRCFFSKRHFCLWSSGKRGKLIRWLKSLMGGRSMFQWIFHCYHASSSYLSAASFAWRYWTWTAVEP